MDEPGDEATDEELPEPTMRGVISNSGEDVEMRWAF